MNDALKVKPYIAAISPYVAGKPIEETAKEYGLKLNEIVKLASNENPGDARERAKSRGSGDDVSLPLPRRERPCVS